MDTIWQAVLKHIPNQPTFSNLRQKGLCTKLIGSCTSIKLRQLAQPKEHDALPTEQLQRHHWEIERSAQI